MFSVKKVYINDKCYEIDIDVGTQDIAWLALTACYMYGSEIFPTGRYTPCMAKNIKGQILHPKLTLMKYHNLIGDEIYVKIRPSTTEIYDSTLNEEEINWFSQAFGVKKNIMDISIKFYPSKEYVKGDYVFYASIKYDISPNLIDLFPQHENNKNFDEELKMINFDFYEKKLSIPFGFIVVEKISYKDNAGVLKEIMDTNKNKFSIEKFPEPLLIKEKEEVIRKKEDDIYQKERNLKISIQKIKEKKEKEEQDYLILEQFLNSIPFSLEEIFEYTNKEITEEDVLIQIFAFLEKDEYLLFKELYDIFSDYSKYNKNNDNISIDAMMNFYNHYFDLRKEELSSLLFECQKFIINRNSLNSTNDVLEFNFLDFVFSIISILYNINITGSKEINITEEMYQIYKYHEDNIKEKYYYRLFKDENVVNVVKGYVDLLKKIFENYGTKSFNGYSVMSLDQFKSMIKNWLKKKKKDQEIEKLLKNINFKNIDFMDFLQYVINVADLLDDNPDVELSSKIIEFVNIFSSSENLNFINK